MNVAYPEVQFDRVVVIAVGARLEAELADRPIARDVAAHLTEAFDAAVAGPPGTVVVGVCTDLWYLNQEALRGQPLLSLGPPAANAATAWLADKLPSVAAEQGQWMVQMRDGAAAAWGNRPGATARAARVFLESHADAFVEQAIHLLARAAHKPR